MPGLGSVIWRQPRGIDFERLSLTEAADQAVSQLERQRDAGLSLRPQTVQFAALLVRIEGEMVASGAMSAEPFIERAYALDRARLSCWPNGMQSASEYGPGRQMLHLEPEEPEPEPFVTVLRSHPQRIAFADVKRAGSPGGR